MSPWTGQRNVEMIATRLCLKTRRPVSYWLKKRCRLQWFWIIIQPLECPCWYQLYVSLSTYHKQKKNQNNQFYGLWFICFCIMLFYMYMYIIPVTQFRKADWDLWKAPFLSITLLPGVPSYSGRTAFSMVVTETLVTSCFKRFRPSTDFSLYKTGKS